MSTLAGREIDNNLVEKRSLQEVANAIAQWRWAEKLPFRRTARKSRTGNDTVPAVDQGQTVKH